MTTSDRRCSTCFPRLSMITLLAAALLLPAFATPPAARAQVPRLTGPQITRAVLARMHAPSDTLYTQEELDEIWAAIRRMPDEPAPPPGTVAGATSWELVGPWSLQVGPEYGDVPWTGRVRKVEADPANPHYAYATRWGTDRGGLWSVTGDTPQAISDSLESLSIGSFATDPTDRRVIILGTGNQEDSGRGVFRTEDEGAHWTHLEMSGGGFSDPLVCWEIRFHPLDPSRVYIAANSGFFESTDGGETFQGIFKPVSNAYVTDIAFDLVDPDIIYVGVWRQSEDPGNLSGVYKGDVGAAIPQFVKQAGGLPQTNCGRVSLASALRPPNTTVVYAAIADVAGGQRGVYRTTNGTGWTDISPTPDDPDDLVRAWHNHTIGVAPWNSDVVLVGYVRLYMSTNGGSSWAQNDVPHADQMDIAWNQIGPTRRLLVANDGGVFTAVEGTGYTEWQLDRPHPVTEIYYFDVDPDDPTRMGLGAQDSGISLSMQPFFLPHFVHELGGDGGMVAIPPSGGDGAGPVYVTNGPTSGPDQYWRGYRTEDWGDDWTVIDDEFIFTPADERFRTMRLDAGGTLYTSTGNAAWVSENGGDDWHFLAAAAVGSPIRDITPANDPTGAVWVTSSATTGEKRVLLAGDGVQFDRTAGLPDENSLLKVVPRPTFTPSAVAVFEDRYTPGEKFWHTFDFGLSWASFGDDLPNFPLSDLAIHPQNGNLWFLAAEQGIYRTTNGGMSWTRWMRGLPRVVWATELRIVSDNGGGSWLYASTYGRGIWRRPIDETISTGAVPPPASRLSYTHVGPNPFSERIQIRFQAQGWAQLSLKIIDVQGRLVRTWGEAISPAGEPAFVWDGRDDRGSEVADGVYFAVLGQRGGEVVTRRLVRQTGARPER